MNLNTTATFIDINDVRHKDPADHKNLHHSEYILSKEFQSIFMNLYQLKNSNNRRGIPYYRKVRKSKKIKERNNLHLTTSLPLTYKRNAMK